MNTILKWELFGIIFVFLFGALLPFFFEWSGELPIVGMIAPVNESVWEHFKLGYLPMLIYAMIEYKYLKGYVSNFLTAKAIAIYLIPIVTAVVFYAYTAIAGEEILVVDILIFLVAITIGQLTSYKILMSAKMPKIATNISVTSIILLGFILVLFTYSPPHLPIFLDPTGIYGIP
jgi:hypothetical protein